MRLLSGYLGDHLSGFWGDHLTGFWGDHLSGFWGDHLTWFWGDHLSGFWGDHLTGFWGDHLSMLPLDHQVTLLGMDSNSRPSSEAVEVVVGEWLAGIGGYGVAMLLKLLMGTACMATPTSYGNREVVWHSSAEWAISSVCLKPFMLSSAYLGSQQKYEILLSSTFGCFRQAAADNQLDATN